MFVVSSEDCVKPGMNRYTLTGYKSTGRVTYKFELVNRSTVLFPEITICLRGHCTKSRTKIKPDGIKSRFPKRNRMGLRF